MGILDIETEVRKLRKEVEELKKQITSLSKFVAPTVAVGSWLPVKEVFGEKIKGVWSSDYEGPNGFFNDPNRPFP